MKCVECGLEEVEIGDGTSMCRLCWLEYRVKDLMGRVNELESRR